MKIVANNIFGSEEGIQWIWETFGWKTGKNLLHIFAMDYAQLFSYFAIFPYSPNKFRRTVIHHSTSQTLDRECNDKSISMHHYFSSSKLKIACVLVT